MRGAFKVSAIGAILLGLGAAACAGLVGADFDDVHAQGAVVVDSGPTEDASIPPPVADTGVDAPVVVDAKVITPDDAGLCTAGLSECLQGGTETCVDLSSNPDHCHACGTVCPNDPQNVGTPVCTKAGCTFSCPAGYELCQVGSGCCAPAAAEAGTDAGTDPGIPCGNAYCSTANSATYCCGEDVNGDDVCTSSESTQCDYAFSCASSAECSGESSVCCYDDNDPDEDENGKTSSCQNSCSDDNFHYFQFCNPARTGDCPDGMNCTGSFDGDQDDRIETTYHFCQ